MFTASFCTKCSIFETYRQRVNNTIWQLLSDWYHILKIDVLNLTMCIFALCVQIFYLSVVVYCMYLIHMCRYVFLHGCVST